MSDATRPRGLHAAGRRAWDRAVAGLTDPEREQFADLAERFARQVDVAEALRCEWVRLKRPTTAPGSGGTLVTHPLIASMRIVDATVASLARALRLAPAAATPGKVGRPTGAVSAPDRKASEPPRIARLKAVP